MIESKPINRRKLIKQGLMGCCTLAWTAYSFEDFLVEGQKTALRMGFSNDAPAELWEWSKEAQWYELQGKLIRCKLCPHECILGENDRGFCRTRVVKNRQLHTVAYGNPCSVHLDPMEKKPLYHFLPGTPILSIATAGCNLRCLNCQNWEISQSRPKDVKHHSLMPKNLVDQMRSNNISAIAYTYSEPIIFYEYVWDTANLAKEHSIKNVMITAGYISEKPLRQICQVINAANVDLKAFNNRFYKSITGAKLEPVLRSLEIMIEKGVWVEITRLIVPTLSDDLDDIRAMCDWMVNTLGPGVPLHFSRFHPAHKLKNLPPTPVEVMKKAYDIAQKAGIHFIYVGNLPGNPYQDTVCPKCKTHVIQRQGYAIRTNQLENGRCPCGEKIPGVWQ